MTDLGLLCQQRDDHQLQATNILLNAREQGRNTLTAEETAAYRRHMAVMRALHARTQTQEGC